jgi:hypothetical protein
MARTGNNQRSANRVAVDVGATGTKPASKGAVLMLIVSVLAALWAVAMMTTLGRLGYYYLFIYLEYYMGVIALVSLSITIMVGLVATDRLVLSIRQRVMLQSTHRTTGLIAVAALFVHVWSKVAEKHIGLIDAFIPFLSSGNRLYVGMGTLSGWIMILVMWTGIARSRFIGRGKPWMWRSIHAISYLMWPIALMHGLAAGRPAKAWVIVSYIVCILLVLVGLAVRLSVSLNRNKDFSSAAGMGVKPAGTLVPTASPAMKKPRKREREPEPEVLPPVAVVDTFQPVRPTPAQAPPRRAEEMPRQRRGGFPEDDRPRRGRMQDDIEYDEPRGLRYPGEETSTRMRRPDREDTAARMRRADLEDTSARLRRAEMDDTRMFRPVSDEPAPRQRRHDEEEPTPRSRRRAVEPGPGYDEEPRGRRRAGADDYEEMPRQRGGYEEEPTGRRGFRSGPPLDDTGPAPQGRRARGADSERTDSGRHSRSSFLGLGDGLDADDSRALVDTGSRRSRRAEQQEPARSRRGGRAPVEDELADDDYWSQLRGDKN